MSVSPELNIALKEAHDRCSEALLLAHADFNKETARAKARYAHAVERAKTARDLAIAPAREKSNERIAAAWATYDQDAAAARSRWA